jgi:hypothetical protein
VENWGNGITIASCFDRLAMRCFAAALACLLIATAAATAHAAVAYVNKDNPCPGSGTIANPYCSIRNALEAARPGTDIRIQKASGAYDECSDTLKISGTFDAPITIKSDNPVHPPRLTCSMQNAGEQMMLDGVNYVTVRNLIWDGTNVDGVPQYALIVHPGCWSDCVGIRVLHNSFLNWGAYNSTGYADDGGSFYNASILIGGPYSVSATTPTISGTMLSGNTFNGDRARAIEETSDKSSVISNNLFENLVCGTDHKTSKGGEIQAIHNDPGTATFPTAPDIKSNIFENFVTSPCPTGDKLGFDGAFHADDGASNGTIERNYLYDLPAP